jgi:NitT/TauT family transport system substrate-binding protein
MSQTQSRRRFLTTLSGAGAAALLCSQRAVGAERSLETTTVRVAKSYPVTCLAPTNAADELLRTEGFTDIRYVEAPAGAPVYKAMAAGELDFAANLPLAQIEAVDKGAAVIVLGGLHVGCYELFAQGGIRSIADLKGKSVGLQASPRDLLTLMAAHVGLDPAMDIKWVTAADPLIKPLDLFADGKIDAFLGFPPEPQELRARHAGHVILSTAMDRPWSQYFCCMIAGNSDYVRQHPVATKCVLRAFLKAADLCITEPASIARRLVDGGFTPRYDYALQTLNEVPYDRWRDYDAEDSIRFYALRLHEAGLIKSAPNKIIGDGTDWRFFNELKRELKA